MRTDSHRLAGTLVALGFLAGWFSASWVSPPAAVTQARPSRPAAPAPDITLPRIALDVVTAPPTMPATARNPFMFAGRGEPSPAAGSRASVASAGAASTLPPDDGTAAADVPVADAPEWRVIGIASTADGVHTAVVSGGGEVRLLTVGAQLPGGLEVIEIDASRVVLRGAGGEPLTLRLP